MAQPRHYFLHALQCIGWTLAIKVADRFRYKEIDQWQKQQAHRSAKVEGNAPIKLFEQRAKKSRAEINAKSEAARHQRDS